MSLTPQEIENLRFHLGYGNIAVGGYPYTPDGFLELFRDVIAPNLTGDNETSATTDIEAGETASVAPVSMTGIAPWAQLLVDVGDAMEIVIVKATTATSFTATFSMAHDGTGYPVMLLGGKARLRMLLHQADMSWQAAIAKDVSDVAGIKSVDGGDIEFFQGFEVLSGKIAHYKSIVQQISRLTRVRAAWEDERSRRATTVETY